MFVKKSFADEIANSLEENIDQLEQMPEKRAQERQQDIVQFLSSASQLLDNVGLEIEASEVMAVLQKIADDFGAIVVDDPALPHSSEEALKNLSEKGWVFNIGDVKTEKEPSANKEEFDALNDFLKDL